MQKPVEYAAGAQRDMHVPDTSWSDGQKAFVIELEQRVMASATAPDAPTATSNRSQRKTLIVNA